MVDIGVFGIGVAAEVLASYILADPRYDIKFFLVDNFNENHPQALLGIEVCEYQDYFTRFKGVPVINSVGYKDQLQGRDDVFNRMSDAGIEVLTYTHPSSFVSHHATLGAGSIVLANSTVEPYVKIEKNTFIWSNCTIAHHTSLGRSNWIASGVTVSGHVDIGDRNLMGVNSTVSNDIVIGNECIICGGAFVSKNVEDNTFWIDERGGPANVTASKFSRFLK